MGDAVTQNRMALNWFEELRHRVPSGEWIPPTVAIYKEIPNVDFSRQHENFDAPCDSIRGNARSWPSAFSLRIRSRFPFQFGQLTKKKFGPGPHEIRFIVEYMAIAGHVSQKMLAHYSRIRLEAKRQVLDALAAERVDADKQRTGGRRYVTKHVTNGTNRASAKPQVIEKNGRPVRARTADLYRVKVAL